MRAGAGEGVAGGKGDLKCAAHQKPAKNSPARRGTVTTRLSREPQLREREKQRERERERDRKIERVRERGREREREREKISCEC